MEKRVRSPNYPALSLPDAVDKVTALYRNLHTHAAPREVIAKGMGYNSLNGASATAISALHKYGLLERTGEEVRISDRAMCILHPQSAEERRQAIREAGAEPPLFIDLAERFPGQMPNEELLRNYLVRKGFAPSAVPHVILAYRDTSDFVEREAAEYDSQVEATKGPAMQSTTPTGTAHVQSGETSIMQGDSRQIGRYDFEGGGYVQILAGGVVDTETALDMLETLVGLKRKEIERRKATVTPSVTNIPEAEEDSE
jgi:hypothetical protein